MEKFKKRLSFRKKKDRVPESSKPHQWQEDEKKVRDATCSFQVRYLGCIEVFESRGMTVCEEAVKALKARNSRSVWARMSLRKKKSQQQCKGKYQRTILYVSGDALRVVDEISKGLIVDQTIEKVSFCAPDRNHEKGFAYICRDGTSRRWMCHAFLAVKESGERLSHAVGCAFAVCLEKKQKRDKESGVTVTFNDKGTSFTRTGSFRPTTITERIVDPQSAIVAEPVPIAPVVNPHAVQRPHATTNMLLRQGSFRVFSKLQEGTSPFKRQLSLCMDQLPSTLERYNELTSNSGFQNGSVSPIQEVQEASPTKENPPEISQMCQQLTYGLSELSSDGKPLGLPAVSHVNSVGLHGPRQVASRQHHTVKTGHTDKTAGIPTPILQTNPWSSQISDAEMWLHSTANTIGVGAVGGPLPAAVGTIGGSPNLPQNATKPPFERADTTDFPRQKAPSLDHTRSHSIDASEFFSSWQKKPPTLRELSERKEIVNFQSQQNGAIPEGGPDDGFEAAWAARPAKKQESPNPFKDKSYKAFEVQL